MKAKKSPGKAPWGRNDDRKKETDRGNKGTESITVKGRKGAVTIDFRVFARRC